MAVHADVAQGIERLPPEQEVGGSNPLIRTLLIRLPDAIVGGLNLCEEHLCPCEQRDLARRYPVIGKQMHEAMLKQLNMELYSYYLYMGISAYFEDLNLKGMASWHRVQAQEEMFHAMKFYDHLLERRAKVTLAAIDAPPPTWPTPLAAFEAAMAHEEKVTASIDNLSSLAVAEKDHASHMFLDWFVNEQVEELASVDNVVQDLKLVGNDKGALFFLDRELGQRVFTPPTTGAAG
jgi:ferritin